MDSKEIATSIIIPALSQFLGEHSKSLNSDSKLFGAGGVLDSINFVGLLIEIESRMSDLASQPIRLVNDKAFSRKQNPFATIDSLSLYLMEILEGVKSGK